MSFFASNPHAPRKGWSCSGVSVAGPKPTDTDTCEICGTTIRFIHHMYHPAYPMGANVGCQCASRMEDTPRAKIEERDREARSRHARREAFCAQPNWRISAKGDHFLRHLKVIWLIRVGKFGGFRGAYKLSDDAAWEGPEKWSPTLDEAKLAAFDHKERHHAR